MQPTGRKLWKIALQGFWAGSFSHIDVIYLHNI